MLPAAVPPSVRACLDTRVRAGTRARVRLSFLSASALLLAGCGREQAPTNEAAQASPQAAQDDTVVFRSGARDRLCLKDGQVAVVSYAQAGNANCTVRGTLDTSAAEAVIRPDGDTSCAIPMTRTGDRATLGAAGPACAYYCGPGASLEGKSFDRAPTPEPVTDVAGDPLC